MSEVAKKINLPKPLFSEKGKRAVLLLHAYSGSSNDVRMLSRRLEKENYTVYSPNFSGHGTLVPEDILDQTTEQWWQDTQEAVAFLRERGYQEIAIFGLSMGGIFSMHALTEQLTGLIGGGFFCSPIYPVENKVPENFVLYAENVMKIAEVPAEEQQSRLQSIEQRVKQQLGAIETIASQTADKLNKIHAPLFLAQAGKDEMIEPMGVYQTAQALTQARVTLQCYPNSGHVITVSGEHKQLEQDVVQFLATLPWNEEK
ncbi:MAG: alpha/beta fold hydrolase [Enterococcus faecalis]|nr:alpha/beta fold hydrolase [Enterococcus faecalis]MDU3973287.1 alpha/beta fold hydrolase [Enterococcus faecalis]MDU4366148.1 alpha/beta fold hydrolase [Enterococcus faecalis]MDU6498209.1 alpha/beta fold hydrolase [Enterococcus faecalis]HBE2204988.1 alpha/beta fold hydrolase [Enterococcus faecalis]